MALTISPLEIKLDGKKGETIGTSIMVTNPNSFTINVKTESEDFIQGSEQGAPQFIKNEGNKHTLSGWVSAVPNEFSLNGLETRAVEIKIAVPKNAEPGGHYAAVFFRMAPKSGTGETQLGVSGRVGTLVLVSVPGAVKKNGEIASFRAPKIADRGPINFELRFKNTGTVHYSTAGTTTVSSIFGKNVARVKIPEHTVLPDSAREFSASWQTGYRIGIYKATAQMKDGAGGQVAKTVSFVMFPWKIALIALAGLVVLGLTIRLLMRKFKIVSRQ